MPQITIGAENMTPSATAATTTTQISVAIPITAKGRQPTPHIRFMVCEVAAGHLEGGHGKRADRSTDPEGCHHERVVAGATPEPILDQERE